MSRSRHPKHQRVYKKDTKQECRSKGRSRERAYCDKVRKDANKYDEDFDPEYKKAGNYWNWD